MTFKLKKNHLKQHDSKIGKIKIRITSCDVDGVAGGGSGGGTVAAGESNKSYRSVFIFVVINNAIGTTS